LLEIQRGIWTEEVPSFRQVPYIVWPRGIAILTLCLTVATSHWAGAVAAEPLAVPAEIKAYDIDFNWGPGGPNGFARPGLWAEADPAEHVAWYKALGCNVIQTFCVSCNGYAWYKNGVVPEQPGLQHDFLPEMVKLAHENNMLVLGYFCAGSNTRWGQARPDLSYGFSSQPHIPYTDEYLAYLDGAIRDVVGKTGIDGFMVDWLRMPTSRESNGNRWLDCEKKLYAQLMGQPFPGEDKLVEAQMTAYGRKAIDRCWGTIRKAAKETNPACLVWLTCCDINDPHIANSRALRETDWLLNEAGDLERTAAAPMMIGPQTRLITCLAAWNNQNPEVVIPAARKAKIGLYGFTKPTQGSLKPSVASYLEKPLQSFQGDDRNIAALARAYLGLSQAAVRKAPDADGPGAAPAALRAKTLVAWVRLADLLQTGSGVLAIQDGDEFDAITFGERVPGRWMAGSHGFSRTQSPAEQQALAPETAAPDQWLQVAVVYRGRQIEIWRNGHRYAAYETPNQQTYSAKSELYIGLRCLFGRQLHGFFKGAVNEVRIYNSALDGEVLAQLKPGSLTEPKPLGCWTFDEGSAKDVMGHYPDAQLSGTAKIKDGALVLDGQGYALISRRLIANYRPPTVQAGFYTPPHRVGEMWDSWIEWRAGVYYMYYIAGPFGRWDAHEIAVSPDGVHWDYQGVAIRPRPQTTWVGTGHVWKSPDFATNGQWVLNYSECMTDNKQDIMFATSPDLLHWTKVDESLRFVQDTRWYKARGRWDCIDAIPGDDGWLYGYFTADPEPAKVNYPHCGFGFARSKDGLRWEAQPPVPGNMTGEFGGIQKIGDKYYITVSEGRVAVAASPKGPFVGQLKNHNVFGGDIYFPRFFHTAPDGPLVNHFYTAGPIYAAPLKAINIDGEGILRLVWWPGNEKLKAAKLPATRCARQGVIQWLDASLDVNQTLVIEGTAHLPEAAPAAGALLGLLIDQGAAAAEGVSFERTRTLFGDVQLDAQPMSLSVRQTAQRDLDFGTRQRFRVLLNRDLMEVYVNDYLTLLARVKNTGRLGLLTGTAPGGIDDIRIWRSANASERP
jgi:hypothetical protein